MIRPAHLLLLAVTLVAALARILHAAAPNDASTCASRSAGAALLQVRAGMRRLIAEENEQEFGVAAPRAQLDSRSVPGNLRAVSALQRGEDALLGKIGRSRGQAAYSAYMWRQIAAMEAQRNVSNSELDGLITRFIEAHTTSEDNCPPKLMEAKHQLNQLHKEVLELAELINETESNMQKRESLLQEGRSELVKVTNECNKREAELRDKKSSNFKMLQKLRTEMEEMRAIAQPQVAMNLSNRSLKTTGGSLGLMQKSAEPLHGIVSSVRVAETEDLVSKAKGAANIVLSCLASASHQSTGGVAIERRVVQGKRAGDCGVNSTAQATLVSTFENFTAVITLPTEIRNGTYRSYSCTKVDDRFGGQVWLRCVNSVLTADARGCMVLNNTAKCTRQKADLESAYLKAYVELSRLIAECEELHSSTDAEDALRDECKRKKEILQQKQAKLISEVTTHLRELQGMRPKLEDMLEAERKLRKHVSELTTSCSQLAATGRGLDSVRDAIHALEACPGLYRPEFHIPLWAGKWATFELDNTKSDSANDEAMDAACKASFGEGVRAAEVSEIEGGVIEGMPRNNTAGLLLLGACPKCEGKADSETGLINADGHSRVCWDMGKPLNRASRREDCSKHMKAIACVRDRGDIRRNDWAAYTSVCAGSNTSFSQWESQMMLNIHNKMRCTMGASPLKWSRSLQCQAQKVADKCKFEHSDAFNSPIPASENLATGKSISLAAWMWYAEYTEENPARSAKVGHFTAMVWNSSSELGCGICRSGKGVVVCQYANSSGNLRGEYDKNVPNYEGHASDYERCDLDVSDAKQNIQKFKEWGIISPLPAIVANLG